MRKLAQKNLFYSLLLAAAMMLFLVGYFMCMLPSLYVSHMKEQNLEAIKEQHRAYVAQGTYEGVQVKNPTACASVKIPLEGDSIILTTKPASIKVTAREGEIREILREIQEILQDFQTRQADSGKADFDAQLKKKLSGWQGKLENVYKDRVSLPVDMKIIHNEESKNAYFNETYKLYPEGKMVIMEAGVEDDSNQYTTYFAAEKTADAVIFSLLPVVTPQMAEIRPVVVQSLPMLGAVILILVLVFSQIYSGGIVSPILKLVQHTQAMKADREFAVQPLGREWQGRSDEVTQLAVTIDELYQQVREGYQELQAVNQELLEENERQEVFLRASSHQLKTPITAALLLLDGMINQIGKYKDTKTYLPKVKEQLLFMRKMVEDILSLNLSRESISRDKVNLYSLVQAQLAAYQIAAGDKHLDILMDGDKEVFVYADYDILAKILDNLLSNAVNYTPQGGAVRIWVKERGITIQNRGVAIPQEILQHIFEPFVRGNHGKQSHGLGLYIAAYYAKLSDACLAVRNCADGVEAELEIRA